MVNKLINKSVLLFLIITFMLSGCSSTVERLRRVGKAPDLAKLEIPEMDGDSLDPEQVEAQHEYRRKRTNSLWQPGSTTFFRDNRAWRVGDIVTITIAISDSAALSNSTQQQRTGADSLAAPVVFGKEKAISTFISSKGSAANLLSTSTSRNQLGTGTISRKEAINTTIAAIVKQVMPNGNLVIQGKQEVRVNHELREVRISGIIRPRDISSTNTISSNQIAEARVSYGGRGIVSDVQQPRVGSQVLDILSPF